MTARTGLTGPGSSRTTTGSSEVRCKDGRLWVDCKNRDDAAGELKDYHSELRSQVEGEGNVATEVKR